jgi:glyoxylase-like metal-dependent hydrolase (beta-lactamase superfamily II)
MNVEISSLEGNRQKLDGGAMFGNAPRGLWQRWLVPDELSRIDLACRSLLVEFGSTKILFETGVGAYFDPTMAERYGIQDGSNHLLLDALKKRGLTDSDIDYVVLSHLHFDHAGGLFSSYQDRENGATQLLFPNAKFIVSEVALERNENPHLRDRASFITELPELLKKTNRLIVVDPESVKLPSEIEHVVSFVFSDGHTPGQMHSIISGDQRKIFFCGDLIPGKPWIHVPITMGYDRFPELLIDEKEKYLARATEEEWLLFLTHDPETAATQCCKNEKGRYVATRSIDALNSYSI